LRHLDIDPGAVVGLAGFDQTTAEVFVNLATGATLPEEGTVEAMGRATKSIGDSDEWLAMVDRFGIISERVVLLEHFTPLQNIAMSLTLDVEPLAGDVRAQAEMLAREAGLDGEVLERPVADSAVSVRHRVRLARALAASPSVLLVEHPMAGLDASEVTGLARDLARVASARELAVVVLAAEAGAAAPFAPRLLTLNGGTGELTETGRGFLKKLFG
jgi:ABC-type transporter Mla maintaining outer membrane lipid asymmetry ATPase subunit MlaF